MRKFLNKVTNEIEEADNFTKLFAFSHNSNYECVDESSDYECVDESSEEETETKKVRGRKLKESSDNNEVQEQEK